MGDELTPELLRTLQSDGYQPVRCNGCNRVLAHTRSATAQTVWCLDSFCRRQPPPTDHEAEDDLLYLMSKNGKPFTWLANSFGITRQRVDQITKLRGKDEFQRRTVGPRA